MPVSRKLVVAIVLSALAGAALAGVALVGAFASQPLPASTAAQSAPSSRAAPGSTKAAALHAALRGGVDARFAALERTYAVYIMQRFPVVGTYLGGAGFDPALADVDGELRDYTPAGLAAEDARLQELRAKFLQFDPRRLSARRRIDRTVALAQIDFLLHQHEVLHHSQRSLDSYTDEPFRGVDWQLQGMTPTGASTLGTQEQWNLVIRRTRAIPQYLEVAQEQLAAGVESGRTPDWRMLMQFGLGSTAADAEYFSKTLPELGRERITGSQRESQLKQLQQAGNDAAAAYIRLRDYVAATFFVDPGGTDVNALKPEYRADRYALGEADYDWALHNNLRLPTTALQLYTQSWPVVLATRGQLIALARSIATEHGWSKSAGSGDGEATVRLVFDKLGQDAPATDADMIALYRRTGERLVDYARRTRLFDVPADYKLDVTLTPPPLRASIDGAAYYPAPVFKPDGAGRFYVTPTNNDPALLRQLHNTVALPDLAAHEGFPGHDWHYKVMARYRNDISPIRWLTPGAVEDSSSMWEDSLAAEGWALYAEALMAEPQPSAPQGFYSPEERLYQLQGKLFRDLRVRIDTGIHTGRLSFEDAVTLYTEVVDFLPGSCRDPKALELPAKAASCKTARAAVMRYARWPTQAITYRLGREQILALRHRAQRLFGPAFSERRFHLEFMKQGTIPSGYFTEDLLQALGEPPK